MNHIATMSYYGTDLQDQISEAGQQDDMYMDLRRKLQQVTCNQDVDCHFRVDGLVRFWDRIYVLNDTEVKKTILR